MKGILNINKPKGMTCNSVVGKVRKILSTRAVGHMGTLDPAGEGVLPIGVGKATRLFDYYLSKDKVYEAEFAFGYETDTLDGDGKVQSTTTVMPDIVQLKDAVLPLIGKLNQIPPKYSAKSIDGRRAYDMARQGIEFELKSASVTVYSFDVVRQTAENTFLVNVHCSSGTYIRSLCRDVAYSLNSLATMVSIRRLRCGEFTIENSINFEQLEVLKEDALISVEHAINQLPKVYLDKDLYQKLSSGIKIPCEQDYPNGCALYCADELFGIAINKDGNYKIKTYLKD